MFSLGNTEMMTEDINIIRPMKSEEVASVGGFTCRENFLIRKINSVSLSRLIKSSTTSFLIESKHVEAVLKEISSR